MVRFVVVALAAASLLACSRNESASPSATKDEGAPAAPPHAPAGARPGSHEDWCAEHGVPESVCSRCNPSLVPAFKATGDWCAEHGLPESQCLACNPDLKIERPAPGGK